MSLSVASLHVYPIKSLGGYPLDGAQLTDRGFEHDRRWMLVDEDGRFLTQREAAVMACLHTSPLDNGFRATDVRDGTMLDLPWTLHEGEPHSASVWDDRVEMIRAPQAACDWFSRKLERACMLVYMPDKTLRPTDPKYADAITSLSDGFPFSIISQATLDELNDRLDVPVGMERFRPNIVISGGTAHQEDGWQEIMIADLRYSVVRTSARCVIINTDQRTGERTKEPLRTLTTYRKRITPSGTVRVEFGMNAVADGKGILAVGDVVTILGAH